MTFLADIVCLRSLHRDIFFFVFQIYPKIKKDEALVHHGTEFPMGEEDKTMLECSLHRRLEIADVLYVHCKMVLGHVFSVEEPCTVCRVII